MQTTRATDAVFVSPSPSRGQPVSSLECRLKRGTPQRAGQGRKRSNSKYAPIIEMARNLTESGTYVEVSSGNTKGCKLTAAIKAAFKLHLTEEELAKFDIFTQVDGNTIIQLR